MPTSPSARSASPPDAPALRPLAEALAEEPGGGWLVRVIGSEVGLQPLDGAHPVDRLTGFVAPSEWQVLGIVVNGTASHPDGGGGRRRVRLVYLLDRSGASASVIRGLDQAPAGAPCGRLVDVCRRALGRPTEPPAGPPLEWWSAVWLDRILAEAAAAPTTRWTWRRVLALHPLGDPATAAGLGWEDLRRLAATPGAVGLVDPAVAGWLDEGSFARWLLGEQLPLSTLLREVGALLPPSVHERVRVLLAGQGLP